MARHALHKFRLIRLGSRGRCLLPVLLVLAGLSPSVSSQLLASTAPPAAGEGIDWKKEKEFWSFKAPVRHSQPTVTNPRWARQPMDFFVLARLDENGLK